MKYPFPLVEITWVDAGTGHGWEQAEELDPTPFEVCTVGFLVRESAAGLVIASTVCPEKTCNSRITIPLGMVKERRVLKAAPAPRRSKPARPSPDPTPPSASAVA